MIEVTFITHDGERRVVYADLGSTLMQAAVDHGVKGITADCGGACACATCQVYIDDPWLAQAGPALEDELAMLEFTNSRRANSRLSCQIKLDSGLNGLVVTTPEQQG